MKYLRLFESKKPNWERKFLWIRYDGYPESVINLFEKKMIEIPSEEMSMIKKNLEKRGLVAIKSSKWWNIHNDRDNPRIGDFIVDKTFFKIDDEYFIYSDNDENYRGFDDEDEYYRY